MDVDVETLPREHIVWMISTEEDCEAEDSDGEEVTCQRMVVVVDGRGVAVGVDMKRPDRVDILTHIEQTLSDAIRRPLAGRPRRPTQVTFKKGPSLPAETLARLGVCGVSDRAVCGCPWPGNPVGNLRACSRCRRRGDEHLFTPCGDCGTVFYCSAACRDQDRTHPGDMHGHQAWCTKMRDYVKNGHLLAQLPFTYTSETTNKNFGWQQYREFLQRHGVYGQGFWERELPSKCPNHITQFGELMTDQPSYVLAEETTILSRPPTQEPPRPLTCWREYYAWRGLSLESLIAALLCLPLTLYHAINQLPQHYPERHVSDPSQLNIHIVGAEKEVDLVPVLRELGYLLPHLNIKILLIGPEISQKVHGKVIEMDKVKVTINKGFYHHCDVQNPDIVLGFNAGLGAYVSWGDTLQKLKAQKTPAFFTDYCHYSCECSRGPMEGLRLGTVSDIAINPFRSPIRRYCEEHTMPWYSNGFMFSLQYT